MLRLPGSWVWDSWPLRTDDAYHLFFLYAPRSLVDPDLRHANARIGHAVSADLRSWTRLTDPVGPGPPGAFDDVACWTGSTVRDVGGRWHLLYTGLSYVDTDGSGAPVERQRIGRATSADGLRWEKVTGTVDADARWYELAGESTWTHEHWRDPWVFADPGGDGWHALVTARAGAALADGVDDADRGVVGHAWSPDLVSWEVRPPLSAPGSGFGQLEVPQLVTVDGRTHLVFSCLAGQLAPWRRASVTRTGHWLLTDVDPLGPYDVSRAVPLTDDTLYAGRVLLDTDGQPVLLACLNRDEQGVFGGVVTDPVPVSIPGRG